MNLPARIVKIRFVVAASIVGLVLSASACGSSSDHNETQLPTSSISVRRGSLPVVRPSSYLYPTYVPPGYVVMRNADFEGVFAIVKDGTFSSQSFVTVGYSDDFAFSGEPFRSASFSGAHFLRRDDALEIHFRCLEVACSVVAVGVDDEPARKIVDGLVPVDPAEWRRRLGD